jgi:hypothetical protein
VRNKAEKPIYAKLRSRRSANYCDLQLTFVNTGRSDVKLEKLKIGPPLVNFPTLRYNCFIFGHRNGDEPRWLIKSSLPELTEKDFIVLESRDEYVSEWMPFDCMYEIPFVQKDSVTMKYRGLHEVSWPDYEHEPAFLVVESNWIQLPPIGKLPFSKKVLSK